MAFESYSSDEESEVSSSSHIDDELLEAFESLNNNYANAIKDNKQLRKKIKMLENENRNLLDKIDIPLDHSYCLLEYEKLINQLEQVKRELNDITSKYTNGNDKFEKMLNMQRCTLSKCGLGCNEFSSEQLLLNKIDHSRKELNFKVPRCSRCLKMGHRSYSCHAPRKVIKIKKVWVPKGTSVPNRIFMANQFGSKWIQSCLDTKIPKVLPCRYIGGQ